VEKRHKTMERSACTNFSPRAAIALSSSFLKSNAEGIAHPRA
jgi:hypothetical protein